jgi:hypothetical protein
VTISFWLSFTTTQNKNLTYIITFKINLIRQTSRTRIPKNSNRTNPTPQWNNQECYKMFRLSLTSMNQTNNRISVNLSKILVKWTVISSKCKLRVKWLNLVGHITWKVMTLGIVLQIYMLLTIRSTKENKNQSKNLLS